MQIFLFTFLVLCLAVFGMSLGLILNKRELKGSCGGIANIPGMKSDCSCSNPCEKRKARMQKEQQEQQEYARINASTALSNRTLTYFDTAQYKSLSNRKDHNKEH